jgi:hypothetical protein
MLDHLAALTNGHDETRLETAGCIAGCWFASMDGDAGHELIAAGLLRVLAVESRPLDANFCAVLFQGQHLPVALSMGSDAIALIASDIPSGGFSQEQPSHARKEGGQLGT